jgi:hypothetical protein
MSEAVGFELVRTEGQRGSVIPALARVLIDLARKQAIEEPEHIEVWDFFFAEPVAA